MPRFAANLSMLWPELDVYDRFAAAAAAGFSRVEILFVHALDRQRIASLLKEHALELVLFDPATILDEATYEDPTRRARGVEWVILGGRPAMRRGDIVDARLGRVVRRASAAAVA